MAPRATLPTRGSLVGDSNKEVRRGPVSLRAVNLTPRVLKCPSRLPLPPSNVTLPTEMKQRGQTCEGLTACGPAPGLRGRWQTVAADLRIYSSLCLFSVERRRRSVCSTEL
ncbi:hypothetical protein AAFF_G00408080 [Aldrovandia affinis]|uniref:Uncharacterized protein n=1 Tax=Aldrovandia affinis TaxID=143900 RepID=A0AAD7WK12_9TELE|nr:hypothetical protein AAFF_G00408080 [Aldrovandia affinis]